LTRVGNQTSFRRDCDYILIPNISFPSLLVGNQTSFRRDCDLFGSSKSSLPTFLVGNQTSFRRDCDPNPREGVKWPLRVGNQTSFRRDCDIQLNNNIIVVIRRKPDLI